MAVRARQHYGCRDARNENSDDPKFLKLMQQDIHGSCCSAAEERNESAVVRSRIASPSKEIRLKKIVKIGGACGAYGDSTLAVPQLLREPDLDYLILDYLSEPVMAAFAKLARAEPDAGYPPDFLKVHIGPFLHEIFSK